MEIQWYLQPVTAWITGSEPAFVRAGGVFNAAFAVFHLMFPRLFNWRQDLRTLTFVNRGITHVLNLCLTAVFVIFAYVSLAHTKDLLSSPLGHGLLVSIALFWLLRAVQQIVFFRMRHWWSWAFFVIFLAGAALYGAPAALAAWSGAAPV